MAILGCLIVALSVSAASLSGSGSDEVSVGGKLGEATLVGLNGPNRRLSAFRGRPLLINVWASWCGPCRQEMSSLERLAWHRDHREFSIIGISTDDYPEKAQGLLRETQATISHYIDSDLRMEHMLGASRLPLTVLVAADGRVLLKVYGAQDWDSADALRLLDSTFRTDHGAVAKSGSLPP